MNKFLKNAATFALSHVDKQSVTQLAVTVANAVARRSGRPGVNTVANLVARSLNIPSQPPNQTAPLTEGRV
jgi:hypothetical protein